MRIICMYIYYTSEFQIEFLCKYFTVAIGLKPRREVSRYDFSRFEYSTRPAIFPFRGPSIEFIYWILAELGNDWERWEYWRRVCTTIYLLAIGTISISCMVQYLT